MQRVRSGARLPAGGALANTERSANVGHRHAGLSRLVRQEIELAQGRGKRLSDFPALTALVRRVYDIPGVAETVKFDHILAHYFDSEGVPAGALCATPVTLCDVSATILDAVGASDAIAELGLPGVSLLDLARESPKDRTVLSESHTYGPNAFYMLRDQRHKYVYYVGAPPQLFDLEADPEELTDLGLDPAHAPRRREFEARLRALLAPELVDREAKADQARMADRYGGFEMLRRREKMAFTPPPTAGTQ